MPARPRIRVLIGPARSGKTSRLLAEYRQVLGATPLGNRQRTLWIAPTRQVVEQTRERLVDSMEVGVLDPGVDTFAGFVQGLLHEAGATARPIARPQRLRLLQHVIAEAVGEKALPYFAAVASAPGLLRLADAWIADMKRRDCWEEQALQAANRSGAARQRDLAEIYARYQQQLNRHGLFDDEGLFWLVRDELRRHKELLAGLQLTVIDGFSDFTAAQWDVIGHIAQRSAATCVSLLGEYDWQGEAAAEPSVGNALTGLGSAKASPCQRDVFAKTRETLAQLRERFDVDVQSTSEENAWPAMAHLQRHLFGDFRQTPVLSAEASDSADRIEILAASSVQGEVEEVARRVKRRLLDGAAPRDVIVVLRSLAEKADRLRASFEDYGIPAWSEAPRRLAATAAVRTLGNVLRLFERDWSYRDLLRVVRDRGLGLLAATGHAGAIERCVRQAQVPRGRAELLAQLDEWAGKQLDGAASVIDPEGQAIALASTSEARIARDALQQLAEVHDQLPQQAAVAQWIEAAIRMATDLGLEIHGGSGFDPLFGLWGTLRTAVRIDRWTGRDDATIDLASFSALLAEAAAETAAGESHDAVGRVRILSAEGARHVTAKHVFLADLSEQSFPQRRGDSSISLNTNGLDQPDAAAAASAIDATAADEMLLFYQLATRAEDALTLSYAALDAKGQAMPPSPFLRELERALGEAPLRRYQQPLGGSRSADAGEPLSRSELRRQAVHQAREGNCRLLAATAGSPKLAANGRAILSGMSCVAQRSRRDRFTAWEGVSDSEPLQRTLAERFGVDHLWSASQLEHYAACPYQFFAEHVLKLAPAPELALQSDMLRRGQLLHSALERLYRDHGAELAALPLDDKLDPQAAETLLERFREMLHASARSPRSRGLDAALRHIERRQIESWGRAFAQQHAAYRKGFRVEGQPLQPTYFEARFGPGSRKSSSAGDAGLSSFEPYRLALPQETIRVTGQIDRIDVAQVGDKTVFNVIDYKASQAKKVVLEKVACGLQLQLAIYALAVQELLLAEKQAQPLSAGYWSVRGSGYGNSAKSPQVLVMNRVVEGRIEPAADWLKLRGEMLASIERIIGGIRGGQFAVFNADKECTKFCSYSKICRIAQVRSLEKSWPLS